MSETYEAILRGMLNRVPSNVDKREGSLVYDALAPCAYFIAQQNFQLKNFIDLVLPDTALGAYLDRAVLSYGLTRKLATYAIRKMTASSPAENGSRWWINDLVYKVTGKDEAGAYVAECETRGDIGNQYSGALQALSGTFMGTAVLTDIITAGADEESDEALRGRFYQKVRLPATSGNAYHYKLWALEVSGVGDAKIFPLNNGPGTVTILIVDSNKAVDESLKALVSEHIEEVRPIGALVTVDSPNVVTVNITASVLIDGSKAIKDIQGDFKKALEEYLRDLVFNDYRVSFAKIGSLLLSIPGVRDYDNMVLNEKSENIVLGEKEIPSIGSVTFLEVKNLEAN